MPTINTPSRGFVASAQAHRMLQIFLLADELREPVRKRILPRSAAVAAVYNAAFSGELGEHDPLYAAELALELLDSRRPH